MTKESPRDRSAALSHLDAEGHARMVDVSAKDETRREALARATVQLSAHASHLLREGNLPKGGAAEMVRIAALQAAKQAAALLPLCHPLRLTGLQAELHEAPGDRWEILVRVVAYDRTGVEMEAMTGAAVGALALYDMVKAVDRSAAIVEVALLEKSGGKSGPFQRPGRGTP